MDGTAPSGGDVDGTVDGTTVGRGRSGADRLSPRQRRVLSYIQESVRRRGYPPTMREIGEAVGLGSTSSVSHQIAMLERKGYLRRHPNRPRAYDVRMPEDAATLEPTDTVGSEAPEVDADDRVVRPIGGRGVEALPPSASLVPLVGRIAAGVPILAEEAVEDVFALPRQLVGDGEHFLLRVVGDSMVEAAIQDGDWVAVRKQPSAESGDIVAAMIEEEATVKRLKLTDDHAWLVPHNPAYDPIPADGAVILGRVVSVLRRV